MCENSTTEILQFDEVGEISVFLKMQGQSSILGNTNKKSEPSYLGRRNGKGC